jgi:hypothetical protein
MPSESPPTQFYEWRKKSRRDVDAGEGSSRNPPGAAKKTVHRDFPRGRMHIDTEIEEVEEDPIETSGDESAKDETYKMSPMPQSENSVEDEIESNDSGMRDEAKKKKGWLRGLSIPNLTEEILSTLALPFVSRTSHCAIMSQAIKAKGQQSKQRN